MMAMMMAMQESGKPEKRKENGSLQLRKNQNMRDSLQNLKVLQVRQQKQVKGRNPRGDACKNERNGLRNGFGPDYENGRK